MNFNSIPFGIFLSVVLIIYWLIPRNSVKLQNALLLVASYYFYAWWDWRFLGLLIGSSLFNYSIGRLIQSTTREKARRVLLTAGVITNIAILGYFKYFGFFIDSFIELFGTLGILIQKPTLQIILPLGISFIVFLAISYIFDIYRNKLSAEKSIVDTLLALGFFPIILAGPIQRPATLLPQIKSQRHFDYEHTVDGLRMILYGLFMKVVIADRCAVYANDIFQNPGIYNGHTLLWGGIFFTVQVYADFAGYSLMAIGVARLLGFDLMKNFSYPYFARDITVFWKRWHISLTQWFRDYVFMPLAYKLSRKIPSSQVIGIKTEHVIYAYGITITWLLTGLWHGANYTFIVWGAINGVLLVIYQLIRKPRKKLLQSLGIPKDQGMIIFVETVFTLAFIVFAWIIFRSDSLAQAWQIIGGIWSPSLFTRPQIAMDQGLFITLLLIVFFFLMEFLGRKHDHPLAAFAHRSPTAVRWLVYYSMIFSIFWFGGEQQQFIYFQF